MDIARGDGAVLAAETLGPPFDGTESELMFALESANIALARFVSRHGDLFDRELPERQ